MFPAGFISFLDHLLKRTLHLVSVISLSSSDFCEWIFCITSDIVSYSI